MANSTTANAEIPMKTLPASQQSETDASEEPNSTSSSPPKAESKTAATSTVVNNVTGEASFDIQRKINRAERFGVPVQLSEEEKQNSRAQRFGIASWSPGSNSSNKSKEVKRKARAEMFGIEKITPTDEEAKKKARLARFAGVKKVDPMEEDKKKERAIRFSQSQSDPASQTNGQGNAEGTTDLGKAGGT